MASTRVRFTLSYVGISMGAVIAFAVMLYFSRLSLARAQLYDQAILFADDIVRDIQLAMNRVRGWPDAADQLPQSAHAQLHVVVRGFGHAVAVEDERFAVL